MYLLYCMNGIVIGLHNDSATPTAPTDYGDGVRIIPWDAPLSDLAKVGDPPSMEGSSLPDMRPYAQPTETPALLIAYSGQVRWETATAGITYNTIPTNTDRVSQTLVTSLAQYAATISKNANIDFTQNGVAYRITAQDAISMNNQMSAFLQSCRTIEAACIADLNSPTPTILTYADVDARFAVARAETLRFGKKA